jgi:hypothetical protein
MSARLSDEELVVLVGLVRLVVHADHQISAAEQDALAALQRRFGADRWNVAVRAGRDRYTAPEALLADARRVRPEVRRSALSILSELAGSDQVGAVELDLLRWVAAEWGLSDPGLSPLRARPR